MADKKDDPQIQHAFVMKGGQKIPIKLRHVSMDEYSRRQASITAEEDAANLAEETKTVKERKAERAAARPTKESKAAEEELQRRVEAERDRRAEEQL